MTETAALSDGHSWLLVTISTGDSSTLRVHAWRRLRSLGAIYLQASVAVLPDLPDTRRHVMRLLDRVNQGGGTARSLHIAILEPHQQHELIEQFQAERSDEYNEIIQRTPSFLDEIAAETTRGRATYAEVEESEADLDRFRNWLKKVQARDYFNAPNSQDAIGAVDACAQALADFETQALAAEVPIDDPPTR